MTDGKIQIFEVSEGNASCLKTIEAIVAAGKPEYVHSMNKASIRESKIADDLNSDDLPCAVAWHPKGEFFVIPTRSHGRYSFISPLALTLTSRYQNP
jgi:hypothetical protein